MNLDKYFGSKGEKLRADAFERVVGRKAIRSELKWNAWRTSMIAVFNLVQMSNVECYAVVNQAIAERLS